MSDTESSSQRRYSVLVGDLKRFIDAKGYDKPCGICGSDDWIIPLEDGYEEGDPFARVQMAGLHGIGLRASLPVHTLMCKDCGNIQLISAVVVREWVEENE